MNNSDMKSFRIVLIWYIPSSACKITNAFHEISHNLVLSRHKCDVIVFIFLNLGHMFWILY